MVQGLNFLSKKSFNPTNQTNRKQVYEAQQSSKIEQERIRKRAEQLRRERDDEELATARKGATAGKQAQLAFMYDAPPGTTKEEEEGFQNQHPKPAATAATTLDVTQVQAGDDAAAAAFRQLLAAQTRHEDIIEEVEAAPQQQTEQDFGFAAVLQGSNFDPMLEKKINNAAGNKNKNKDEKGNLSALEKSVGRRDAAGSLSLEEQVARFPQLKNAPMARGMSNTDVNVSFNPLGAQLRNVKCLSCGIWGHSRGDRECEKSGWNPFAVASKKPFNTTSSILPSKKPYEATTTVAASSLAIKQPSKRNKTHGKKRHLGSDSDSSSTSDSDNSSDDSDRDDRRRKRRKSKKHSSKSKRKSKHSRRDEHEPSSSSSRKRHGRPRSDSPDEHKSKKAHKKHSRKQDDR
jgi:CBF1 interacting corepressor